MLDFLRGVFGIVFLLGFAILVHEFGHFVWAKICGVRVLKFSIGFGKFIWSWKWGETQYGVAMFPLGGYVMLHGAMNPETGQVMEEAIESTIEPGAEGDEAGSTERVDGESRAGVKEGKDRAGARPAAGSVSSAASPGTPGPAGAGGGDNGESKGRLQRMVDAATSDSTALYNKPYISKLLIYSGGVAMNWATAIVAVGLIYAVGFDRPKVESSTVVGAVYLPAGAPRELAPLQPGDRILKAGGEDVADWDDIARVAGAALDKARKGDQPGSITLLVERAGEGETQLSVAAAFPHEDKTRSPFEFVQPHLPAYVEHVLPNKPADKAGLKAGDLVVAVDGQPIRSWQEMAALIRDNAGKELEFEVKRGEEVLTKTISPVENPKEGDEGQIGIMAGTPEREWVQEPVLVAFANAPRRTVSQTVMYVRVFSEVIGRLFRFEFRAVGEDIGGPIQIAQLAYRSAKSGLDDFLRLFFMFNIALAVFNLIPIPLLDGSLLVFATWEAVFRRPFPPRLHIPLLYAGLVLIVILFIAVSVNDMWRFFG